MRSAAEDGLDDDRIRVLVTPFIVKYSNKGDDQADLVSNFMTKLNLFRSESEFVSETNTLLKAVQSITDTRKQLDIIEEKIQKLQSEQSELQETIASKKEKMKNLEDEVLGLEKEIELINNELKELEEERQRLESRIEELNSELDRARARLRTWQQQLAGLKAEERKAYQRFWSRREGEGRADLSGAERESLEQELRIAGDEYISSVFPRVEEVSENNNKNKNNNNMHSLICPVVICALYDTHIGSNGRGSSDM